MPTADAPKPRRYTRDPNLYALLICAIALVTADGMGWDVAGYRWMLGAIGAAYLFGSKLVEAARVKAIAEAEARQAFHDAAQALPIGTLVSKEAVAAARAQVQAPAQTGMLLGGSLVGNPRGDISGEIYQALGEASLCWEPKPVGVFQADRCSKIGERLVARLQDETKDIEARSCRYASRDLRAMSGPSGLHASGPAPDPVDGLRAFDDASSVTSAREPTMIGLSAQFDQDDTLRGVVCASCKGIIDVGSRGEMVCYACGPKASRVPHCCANPICAERVRHLDDSIPPHLRLVCQECGHNQHCPAGLDLTCRMEHFNEAQTKIHLEIESLKRQMVMLMSVRRPERPGDVAEYNAMRARAVKLQVALVEAGKMMSPGTLKLTGLEMFRHGLLVETGALAVYKGNRYKVSSRGPGIDEWILTPVEQGESCQDDRAMLAINTAVSMGVGVALTAAQMRANGFPMEIGAPVLLRGRTYVVVSVDDNAWTLRPGGFGQTKPSDGPSQEASSRDATIKGLSSVLLALLVGASFVSSSALAEDEELPADKVVAVPRCPEPEQRRLKALAQARTQALLDYAAALGRYQGCRYALEHRSVLPYAEARAFFAERPHIKRNQAAQDVAAGEATLTMRRAVSGGWCNPVPAAQEEAAYLAADAALYLAEREAERQCPRELIPHHRG